MMDALLSKYMIKRVMIIAQQNILFAFYRKANGAAYITVDQ